MRKLLLLRSKHKRHKKKYKNNSSILIEYHLISLTIWKAIGIIYILINRRRVSSIKVLKRLHQQDSKNMKVVHRIENMARKELNMSKEKKFKARN